MDFFARIVLGAFVGWLTGKAADGERARTGSSPGNIQLLDAIYGVIGALVGHSLFFWIIIGRSSFGNYATAALGAMALVAAARVVGARVHRARHNSH
jgi:uncharacterized membrane protein YeaQ/YmgE (transglycosylase-associated protein family)